MQSSRYDTAWLRYVLKEMLYLLHFSYQYVSSNYSCSLPYSLS